MKIFTIKQLIILLLLPLFLSVELYAQQKSIWDRLPDEVRDKNSFKRLEWFYRQRENPDGTFPIDIYYSERSKEIEKQKAQDLEASAFQLQWNKIGPNGILSSASSPHLQWGELSGRVRGIAVHPTDPMSVYISVAAGGIWKTTNAGASWTALGDTLASLTFGAIAIDPNNSNTVYAGAGEAMYLFNTTLYDGRGLFKSTDAGNTWTQISNGFGTVTHFSDIEVSPHNSNIVFATLASGYWHLGNPSNEGVWKSTDAGVTWTRTLNAGDAFDILVDPVVPTKVYAAMGGGLSSAGFQVSTDTGNSWTLSNTGLPSTGDIDRIQISQSLSTLVPASPAAFYAIIYTNAFPTSDTRVYKSTDSGTNWSQISVGANLGGNYGGGWVDQGFYDLCIAVNPTDANDLFTGNVELHRATDGATLNVQRVSPGTSAWNSPSHVDIHKIVYAPSNANYMYLGCDGGIYKSTDGGSTWSSANKGIGTIQFYRMASDPNDKDNMVGGAQDNGNFRTTDGGATAWNFVTTGDGMECFYDHSNSNNVYFATQNGALYKSTNGGASASWIFSTGGSWVTPFFQHPTNDQILYTTNTSVYRSTNAGSSFSVIASSVATSDNINTMAQSVVDPNNMIFAASGSFTSTGQVKVSTDAGFTWTDVTANIPGTQRVITRVVTHPSDANTMFVVRSGFTANNKIYRSTDLGATWTNVSGDLPNVPHNDLFIDPDSTSNYYAANDFGVYRSTNGGTTWMREGKDFPFVPVMDFDYVEIGLNRYLRAATHGRSAFETDLDMIVPVELVSFTASIVDGSVELTWTTATETNNMGFEIERSINNSKFEKVGFVNGVGTTAEVQRYSFIDKAVTGKSEYRLKQIDFNGSFEYSNVVEVDFTQVLNYALEQNYPNPFNPITKINFTVPEESSVKLIVYNTIGQVVNTLIDEVTSAGNHEVVWNGLEASSGIYFYTIDVSSLESDKTYKSTRKMILLK
jgi:photosystem II stability/assembly factor-like uncharacterized protein